MKTIQELRERVLHKVYDLANGNASKNIAFMLAETLPDLDEETLFSALSYLQSKGYIELEIKTYISGNELLQKLYITSLAIDKIEGNVSEHQASSEISQSADNTNVSVNGNNNNVFINAYILQTEFSPEEKMQLIELFQEVKDLHQSNPTVSTLADAALAEVNGKADKNSLRKIWDTIVSIGGQVSTSVATAGVLYLIGL